jgi:hypothetical protein
MNSLKRFFLGFLLGIGIMYWYLHHSETTLEQARSWLARGASQYRGDEVHDKARQVLGDEK